MKENTVSILLENRWQENQLVYSYEYEEYMWLKACIDNGVRIGITRCCSEEHPCENHK